MIQQLKYFGEDVKRMLGKHKSRILYIWLTRSFWGLLSYRVDRGFYLLLGRLWAFIRILFMPLIYCIQAFSNLDINYKADIKGGILVLHPSVGVVVSGHSIIGRNLTLTGGNVIGGRGGTEYGGIQIGDNCGLGANAVILGPIKLGHSINVGSLACVVKDCLVDGTTLVGVPAKPIYPKEYSEKLNENNS